MLIGINKKINCVELNLDIFHINVPLIDIVGTRIEIGRNILFIFIIYIPVSLTASYYTRFFECFETLDYLDSHKVFFIGDFNIPEYTNSAENNNNTPRTIALQAFLNFFELVQYNNIDNANNRFLDLVISNHDCHVSKSEDILLKEDAHHPALNISFSIVNHTPDNTTNKVTETYNFRKANYFLLYESILNCDWSFLNNLDDANIACDMFYKALKEIFDFSIPKYIPRTNNKKYPPWFNGLIIKNIKTKFSLWKKYKRTGSLAIYNQFKDIRNRVNKDIDYAYKNYIRNIELNLKNDPKSFWSYVNSKKSNPNIPNNLVLDGNNLHGMQDVVNGFANFFGSAFTNPTDDMGDNNNLPTHNQYLHFTQFSQVDVLAALLKLKPKFVKGPDDVPAFIIRDCAYALTEPLTILFNIVLRSSTIPDVWKRSRVCPVFKKGDKGNIENYRAITIICNFAKVLEIALYNVIHMYIQGQITIHQHGFMRGRSTVTNLFCVTQFIAQHIDLNSQVDVIYTDFSRAFDRLDHAILLRKLEESGLSLPLLSLFKSYLTDRKQYVECRGFESNEITVTSGVPQGSILGPLLFIIFVNDIVSDLEVSYLLYADDVKIFCVINNILDCIKLQNNLNKINDWCHLNNLPLNAAKCNVMTFTKKIYPIWYNYELDNVVLNRPELIKDLGVLFDSKLSFNFHVNEIIKTSYKNLGFITRNSREFTDIGGLMLLFNALVKSKLEYASIVWQPGYNIYTDSLENIQRRFLKFLSYKLDGVYPPIGIPHRQLLDRFSVPSLCERRTVHSLIFLSKLIMNKVDCPQIIEQLAFNIPRIEGRFSKTFYLAVPRTNTLKFSPLYTMCENCNNLQDSIDIFNCSYNSLKNKLYNNS